MSTTISFNSTDLQTANILSAEILHEPQAQRVLNLQALAGIDGKKLVDDRFNEKIIPVSGKIVGSSANDLDTRIIALQSLFAEREKNLDIGYDGADIGTIRYVATPRNFSIIRDHYHIDYVPFSLEFVVPSGVGRATATTNISEDNMTTTEETFTASFTGSAGPKPVLKITFVDSNVLNGVKFRNATTGTSIRIDETFSDADILEIDCENRTVKLNGLEVDFTGVFPLFEPGSNSITMNYYGSGESIDEEQATFSGNDGIFGANWIAQSFQIDGNTDVSKVSFPMRKTGAPPFSTVDLRIETDVAGDPSTTLAHANATASVSVGDIAAGSTSWIDFVFAAIPVLALTTTYWLVLKPSAASGDVANNIQVYRGASAGDLYANGHHEWTDDSGVTWNSRDNGTKYDNGFRIYTQTGPPTLDVDLDIDYYKTYR